MVKENSTIMWSNEQDVKLCSLPSLVVRQILKGDNPDELIGLSTEVLEHIRVHQLTVRDVLLLTGLSTEEAKEIEQKRWTYIHSQHKTGWSDKKHLNTANGKYSKQDWPHKGR